MQLYTTILTLTVVASEGACALRIGANSDNRIAKRAPNIWNFDAEPVLIDLHFEILVLDIHFITFIVNTN